MRWELTEGKEYASDAKMLCQMDQLPEKWKNRPQLDDSCAWVLIAFFELSSCRQVGFGVGPIPWTALKQYAEHHEYTKDEFLIMHHCFAALEPIFNELVCK